MFEFPVCLNVKFAPCWYPNPLSITSTAVTIPLAALASALIEKLSPIGLVSMSWYRLSIVPPAPDVAPVNVPVSLKPTLNDNLLIPTSPVPSPLLLNLYTVPLDTDENDIEPLLATVLYTLVSLFAVFADPIEIAFIVELDVNGWVFTANDTRPFANEVLTLLCVSFSFFLSVSAVSSFDLSIKAAIWLGSKSSFFQIQTLV